MLIIIRFGVFCVGVGVFGVLFYVDVVGFFFCLFVCFLFCFLRTPYPKRTSLMWQSVLFHTRVISIKINNMWLAKRKPFISHGKTTEQQR